MRSFARTCAPAWRRPAVPSSSGPAFSKPIVHSYLSGTLLAKGSFPVASGSWRHFTPRGSGLSSGLRGGLRGGSGPSLLFHASALRLADHYGALGVSKSATPKEIKMVGHLHTNARTSASRPPRRRSQGALQGASVLHLLTARPMLLRPSMLRLHSIGVLQDGAHLPP